jgi:hypothetical protein
MKKALPPIVLFFLAPVIGKLLSGSAPPSEFFKPHMFVVLAIIYGGGALLIREMVIRWGKSWYSILVLGAAYGIIEEGLMVKSFFDPLWQDIGILGYYGQWAGVNWIWSFELTVYHAVISIAIPILLTELLFPGMRRGKWLSAWLLIVVAVYFIAIVVFGNLFLTEYQPALGHYLVALVVVIVLVLIAWRLPRRLFPARDITPRKPVWFWLLGFAAMIGFIIVFWVLTEFVVLPLVTAMLGLMLVGGCFWLVMLLSGNGAAWRDIHRLALASGSLTVFIIWTPLQEFRTDRTGDATGMTIVGIAVLIFLIWLFRKVGKQMETIENE